MKYVNLKNYEQLIQGDKTNRTLRLIQLGLALSCIFLAFVTLLFAISPLFHVSSVHFCLPDDMVVKLILICIKFYIT